MTTLRTPSGRPASDGQLREAQRRQRRLAGRLEHDRVAGRERGAQLPGRDDHRVVPGHDRGDHPDRLAGDERERVGPGRADLAVRLVDGLGVPLEGRGGARDVDRERVADRLADIERFEQGELVEVLADELGEPQQDLLARGRRLVAPAPVIEGPAGGGDSAVDVLGAPLGDPRDRRAVTAGDVVERPPGRRRLEPAVDEQLGPWLDRGGAGEPVVRGRLGRLGRHAANLFECGLVEDDPEPGRRRDAQDAVGAGPDRLGEHEVAPLRGPPGRVVRELDERSASDPGRDLQVGQQPDAVRPGVRRVPAAAREGELGDRPAVQHPGGQHDVGLVDVERVGLDGGQQLGERAGHLAPGDADPGPGRPERRQAGQVGAGQRLLEPQDVVLGELDGDLARGDRIERGRRVAGHPPALVEVDHDRHRIGDRVPCRRDGREPLLEPARIDPDLERREALVAEAERGLGASRRGEQHPARGVRRDPRGRATEQGRDRHARDLAGDVPQRSLERPVATGMEIDRLEDLDLVGDRQRIGADEQVDERVEAVHRVARADADDPLVGLDPHDRGREAAARDGVPGGREGWVERQDQPVEADAR